MAVFINSLEMTDEVFEAAYDVYIVDIVSKTDTKYKVAAAKNLTKLAQARMVFIDQSKRCELTLERYPNNDLLFNEILNLREKAKLKAVEYERRAAYFAAVESLDSTIPSSASDESADLNPNNAVTDSSQKMTAPSASDAEAAGSNLSKEASRNTLSEKIKNLKKKWPPGFVFYAVFKRMIKWFYKWLDKKMSN